MSGRRHKRALLAAILGAGALALAPGSASAAPTDPDLGFGRAGGVGVDVGGDEYANAIARQPDGKLVAVGATGGDALVFRLTADGRLDPSFNATGIRTLDTGGDDYAYSLAIQPDGKIVVVGETTTGQNALVYRLNPDGSFDKTFGTEGIRAIDSGAREEAFEVAIQPDGKIVVVGSTTATNGGDGAVYRLNPDGSLDDTFDKDGARGIDSGGREEAYAVALQPDGKIVVAGATTAGKAAAVYRLNPDGSLDATFDQDGALGVTGPGSTSDQFVDVALQPDGGIVLAGRTTAGDVDGLLARVNPNGTLDRSFDGDGVRTVDYGAYESLYGVGLQPDGRIVAAGETTFGYDALVVSLAPDGSPDRSFTTDGTFATSVGGLSDAYGMGLQPDGKILLVGKRETNSDDAVVARLGSDSAAPQAGGGSGSGTAQQGAKPRCMGKRATIVGTTKADVIRGTSRRDVIVALGGNDSIRGLGGNDIVCGGSGNDLISGGAGRDTLRGEAGRDRLWGNGGRDRLIGGPGRDVTRQ